MIHLVKKKKDSFQTLERVLYNADCIKNQLTQIFEFDGDNGAVMVNNYDWIGKINMVTFLRDYGKYIGINYMLAKDTVASRLETGYPLRNSRIPFCRESILIICMIITAVSSKLAEVINGAISRQD